jgi:hypothetical protein
MEDYDLHPDRDFHSRYRGIVGSLGYLVNMTRPNLAFAYSELSKYLFVLLATRETQCGPCQ